MPGWLAKRRLLVGLMSVALPALSVHPVLASIIASPREQPSESPVVRVPLSGQSKANSSASDSAPSALELGLKYLRDGNPTSAIAQLKAARDLDPQNPIAFSLLCTAYGTSGDWYSALDYARSFSDLAPGNPNARLMLAWCTYQTGDLYEAKSELQSLTQDLPKEPLVHNFLGLVLMDLRRYDDAASEFKQARELDASDPCARMNLVMTEIIQGELDKASREAESLRKEYPASPLIQSLCAYAAVLKHDDALAEQCASESLRLSSSDTLGHIVEARLHLNKNQSEQAITELNDAIKANGPTAFLCSQLSEAYYQNHDYQQAVEQAQTALQLAPSNLLAKRWLAAALGEQGNWDAAVLYLKEVSGRQPKDLQLRLLLGDAQEKRGDLDAAQDVFDAASRAFPTDARPVAALARLAAGQNYARLSKKLARKALSLDPNNQQALALIAPRAHRKASRNSSSMHQHELDDH